MGTSGCDQRSSQGGEKRNPAQGHPRRLAQHRAETASGTISSKLCPTPSAGEPDLCTTVISPAGQFRIRIRAMRIPLRPEIPVLLFGIALSLSSAQSASHPTGTSNPTRQTASGNHGGNPDRALSPDDGLSVIAAALDSKKLRYSERDCSHLVHAIYARAGFPTSTRVPPISTMESKGFVASRGHSLAT